ncbi:MAG: YaaC family protein [Henriciella sp.]|nr:YaaC family protein [Henriciella sp.]
MDKSTWDPLLKFESRDYLARHYQRLHSRSLSASKAHQIGACFTQAREYFTSTFSASAVVKPLLLYYGVASLCRAATLLKDARKTESSLTPAHGLTTCEWTSILSEGNTAILELKVRASKGLFKEFVNAIGNSQSFTWLNESNSTGHFRKDFGEISFISDNSELTLGDLLSREHDLHSEYNIAIDGEGNVDLGLIVAGGSSLKIYFAISDRNNDPKKIEEMLRQYKFPEIVKYSVQPHPKFGQIPQLKTMCAEIPGKGEELKFYAPLAYAQDRDFGWIVRPLPNGDNLIDIHRMAIEAYILGMFSRYYPARWVSLLTGETGDIARTVVINAVARIETQFPRQLSEHIL